YWLFVRKVRLRLPAATPGPRRERDRPRGWSEMTAGHLQGDGFWSAVRTASHEPSALRERRSQRRGQTPGNSDVIDCQERGGLAGSRRREFRFLRWLGNGDGVRGEIFLTAVKRFDCASGTGRARVLRSALT